ncbi:MAG: glycosyltransferase [Polaribacter sp.]
MSNLIIILSDRLGGAEQVLQKITKFHSKEIVDVIFLSKKTSNEWEENLKINLIKDFKSKSYIINLFSLGIYLLQNKNIYTRVYSSQTIISGALGFFRKLKILDTKYLIVRESTSIFLRFNFFKKTIYKWFYRIGYNYTDLIICQTSLMKKQLLDSIPYLKGKVQVVANPFEFPSKDQINEEIQTDKKYIVGAGRLIIEKGFDNLIQAYKNLENFNNDFFLVILGEGPERDNLEKLIIDLGLNNKVLLLGHVKNVYPYFKKASLCVVSSRIEGFPNVLLQMMSVNNNVISTNCAGDISDIPCLQTLEPEDIDNLTYLLSKKLTKTLTPKKNNFNSYLSQRGIKSFMKEIDFYLTHKI